MPISIIVCSKNEEKNLQENIPLWLAQNYPNFELILINDSSSDNTLSVIEKFSNQDSRIKVVDVKNIEAFWANKKYALTLGLKKAINNNLLFTDADCKPASNSWLEEMASHFNQEKQLVLGYGPYINNKGFLNALIRFETLITAIQYFSYAKANNPYMGVGRNLAYTSELYYKNNGFMSHIKITSGDDDLFVNEVATKTNVAICDTPESFTYSVPKKTWKAWILQKRRHITTVSHYKTKHKIALGAYYISTLLFWIGIAMSFFILNWIVALTIVATRVLFQYISVGKGAKKLQESNLILWIPFLELFLICFQMFIFISNSISKPSPWK